MVTLERVSMSDRIFSVFWGVTNVFGVALYFKRTSGNPNSVTEDPKPNGNELASTKYLDSSLNFSFLRNLLCVIGL